VNYISAGDFFPESTYSYPRANDSERAMHFNFWIAFRQAFVPVETLSEMVVRLDVVAIPGLRSICRQYSTAVVFVSVFFLCFI
jgi:hypothetical protein